MARDSSGTFFLAPGNPVISGTIIETGWANPTMADIAAGLTDSLSRSGKGGMGSALSMSGFRITALGAALNGTDAPQATQVRDTSFSRLDPCTSDSAGNNYSGVGLINTPPVNGTLFIFIADKTNTGPMTLSVNGGAAFPILLHGTAVSPGIVVSGAVIGMMFQSSSWRLTNTAGVVGTINSVQSDNINAISVTNDTTVAVATLNVHANVANGLVQLGSNSKIPIAQLPFTDLHFIGGWNATPGANPAAALNGDFYVIVGAGNLTIFRNTGSNVYTAQVTACALGDNIIYNAAGTANQPTGWYYSPGPGTVAAAANVSVVVTPTFPTATNAQLWFNQADPVINGKLAKSGGTMTGQILQPAAPSTGQALANKQYVDSSIASISTGVTTFNTRSGAVTLLSTDVTAGLGFTPANVTGQAFTGPISATNINASGFCTALVFKPTPLISNLTGTVFDFNEGSSQIRTLTAPVTVTAINNISVGAILRLTLFATNNTVTWPATVAWPLGATPDLAAGPLKKAIVVIENDGFKLLASAAAY